MPIKLIDERAQIREVAERWRRQHPAGIAGGDRRTEEIYNALTALDPETATAADVANIIGNESWVKPGCCSNCEAVTYDLVQMGQEPDYESSTADLCRGCLTEALKLLPEPPTKEAT